MDFFKCYRYGTFWQWEMNDRWTLSFAETPFQQGLICGEQALLGNSHKFLFAFYLSVCGCVCDGNPWEIWFGALTERKAGWACVTILEKVWWTWHGSQTESKICMCSLSEEDCICFLSYLLSVLLSQICCLESFKYRSSTKYSCPRWWGKNLWNVILLMIYY